MLDHNESYLCSDATTDPNYAGYFLDVLSVAAVPIPYQKRTIGVLSVSAKERSAFTRTHIEELEELAASSAKFLRRAQLFRAKNREGGRVLLIKGLSPEWLQVERQLEQASPTDAPVLVQGESGTGKELVANAIHFNSRRSAKPFVTVNCAAIPEQLLESTLFGHVRGAFTGASFTKKGEFQKADHGTLFLDEVGDLPLPLQPKVLRAVEYGEVQPVGSNAPPSTVDVRLVCATNHDLVDLVRHGRFREDLYYRIALMTFKLPALRTYKHNLSVLSLIMLRQASKKHDKNVEMISPEAMALIEEYDFPGNVRELKNSIEHAVIMASDREILPEDLPPTLHAVRPETGPEPRLRRSLREMREVWMAPAERQYLTDLTNECGGNVREAARKAGVNVVTMYRLLKKRGLKLTREVHSRHS